MSTTCCERARASKRRNVLAISAWKIGTYDLSALTEKHSASLWGEREGKKNVDADARRRKQKEGGEWDTGWRVVA